MEFVIFPFPYIISFIATVISIFCKPNGLYMFANIIFIPIYLLLLIIVSIPPEKLDPINGSETVYNLFTSAKWLIFYIPITIMIIRISKYFYKLNAIESDIEYKNETNAASFCSAMFLTGVLSWIFIGNSISYLRPIESQVNTITIWTFSSSGIIITLFFYSSLREEKTRLFYFMLSILMPIGSFFFSVPADYRSFYWTLSFLKEYPIKVLQ